MVSRYIEEEEENGILSALWPFRNGKFGGKVGKGKGGGWGGRGVRVSPYQVEGTPEDLGEAEHISPIGH